MKNLFLFILGLIGYTSASIEDDLRHNLIDNYNKYTRPVKNISHTLDIKLGIEIRGLEEFNQKDETAIFNIWMTMMWFDDYLTWDPQNYNNIEYINIDNQFIWKPDIELYNSASKAKVYNMKDKLKLKYDGQLIWVRPASFAFSCPLSLSDFPIDTQTCSMTFGSWSFPENQVLITPFNFPYDISFLADNNIYLTGKIEQYFNRYISNLNTIVDNSPILSNVLQQYSKEYHNISINGGFTHNEWTIIDTNCEYTSAVYLCCPDDRWSVIIFDITLKRNPEKYYLTIVNIVILTLVAICINLIDNRNYSRTFILIFIPLSVIWVLISISNKLPVIGYFTKMDKILLLSFIICEICTYISIILYIFNVSDYTSKFRYSAKFRPLNKYSSNKNFTTFIASGLHDLILSRIKQKLQKIETNFYKEKYLFNVHQNRFMLIKKLVYFMDYLLQFVVLLSFVIIYRIIYYE